MNLFSVIRNERIEGPKYLYEKSSGSKLQCSLNCAREEYCIAAVYDEEREICGPAQHFQSQQPTNEGMVALLRIPQCPFKDAQPNLYRE